MITSHLGDLANAIFMLTIASLVSIGYGSFLEFLKQNKR